MVSSKRALATAALVAVCVSGFAGCSTIMYCKGTTPYAQTALPELWLNPTPCPDPAKLKPAVDRVKNAGQNEAEDWPEVGDRLLHRLKEVPLPVPENHYKHWIAWDGIEGHRVLYVVWGLAGGGVLFNSDTESRTDVYDAETSERLASWGWADKSWILVNYHVKTEPAAMEGVSAVQRLMAREVEPSDLLFDVREAKDLALGIGGWGRANHRKYIQILWIPIATGDETP